MALDRYTVSETGCWLWTGAPTRDGYGAASVNGRTRPAHCAVYEAHRGRIPFGLVLDHTCRNRLCVNPDHLDPVPRRVNTLRGTSPAAYFDMRTHCDRGHEFTPANTYTRKEGGRRCRRCEAERQRRKAYHRRRGAAKKTAATQADAEPLPGTCLP